MSATSINNSLVSARNELRLELPADDFSEKVGGILQGISSITDSFTYNIKISTNKRKLVVVFLDNDIDRVRRVLGLKVVQEITRQSSTHKNKRHTRNNSYDSACQSVEEVGKLEIANKTLNHWLLTRSRYSELQKRRLIQFKELLESKILSLLNAILVLSSEEVRLAKKGSRSKALDNLAAASLGLLPVPGASVAGGAWSFISPIDYILNGGEKKRLDRFSRYLNSNKTIDSICSYAATLITAYYRTDILDTLSNLTLLEEKLEPFKRAFCNLKGYFTESNFKEQYITGSDDKKQKPDTSYQEHWDSLCTQMMADLFNNILLSDELFESHLSIGAKEMAQRLVESLTPISDEPLNFEDKFVGYTLSRLAFLAYGTEGLIYDFVKNKWNYEEYHFFYFDDIQAFLIANDRRVIISFRGTTTRANWPMYNLRTQAKEVSGKRVHSGFWAGLEKMRPHLRQALQENDEREIFITGHSLGGALALLAAFDLTTYLENEGKKISLYTFGQPRCGDQEFLDAVTGKVEAYVRYENYLDPVPHLPRKFKYGGTLQWIDAKGTVCDENERDEAFERPEEEENLTSFHKIINDVSRSETKAIRDGSINWLMHISNHWMAEYHKHLRNAAPVSYTSAGYMEQVIVEHAQGAAVYLFDSQKYKCTYPTRGDGACAIHALCGTLSGGEYVYNPLQQKDRKAVQKVAKQHFIETLKSQLENGQIKQLFMLCLREYFDAYEKDSPLRERYEELALAKDREIVPCHDWVIPFLEGDRGLQGRLLGLLRHNKKEAYAAIDDQQLLEIFRADSRELYFAVEAVKDEIAHLINEIKEEAEKTQNLGDYSLSTLFSEAFLRASESINEIERKFSLDIDEFLLKNLPEIYFRKMQNQDYYLSDNEVELAAYLFSKKILLFSEDRRTVVYNASGKDCIAIEYTPGHYSRLEKQTFLLPTLDKKYSSNPKVFDFKPFEIDEEKSLIAREGLMPTILAEALDVGVGFVAPTTPYIAPYIAFGKGFIQGVLSGANPYRYERDAKRRLFRILKVKNPGLKLFDYIEQGSATGVVEAHFIRYRSFYQHPNFPKAVLPYLIFQDNADHIRFLAEKDIPVNISAEDGAPLVHHLVPYKCYNSFKALVIADDFKPKALDNNGNTVLHCVAQHGELQAFRILHQKGRLLPILNRKNSARKTAITVAAEHGHFHIVHELLSKYPDEIELGDRLLSELLEAGAQSELDHIFQVDPRKKVYALKMCCSKGKFHEAQTLIREMISPFGNERDADGNGLLLIVMKSKSISWEETRVLMQLLLEEGDAINQADNEGKTPLILAASEDLDAMRLLLETPGIDVDYQDEHKNTALHYAALGNRPKTVKTLLAYRANPKLKNIEGKTPLHLTQDSAIARRLVRKGRNPLERDKNGKSPRDYAKAAKNKELAQLLEKYEARYRS